jgi:hypothetical protein
MWPFNQHVEEDPRRERAVGNLQVLHLSSLFYGSWSELQVNHSASCMDESRNPPIIESCQSARFTSVGCAGEHRELLTREAGVVANDDAKQSDACLKAHKARASLVPPHPAACAVKWFL